MRANRRKIVICFYCRRKIYKQHITRDHVWPRSRGGGHDFRNIVPACQRCNTRKADQSLEEYAAFVAAKLGVTAFVFAEQIARVWQGKLDLDWAASILRERLQFPHPTSVPTIS